MDQHLVLSMEPTKIVCPHCGGHHCFEESQDIPTPNGDGTESVTSWMCTDCGYTATTLNKEGSEIISSYEETTAELIKDLRWVDANTNLVWYPIVLNFPTYGIIFPDGTDKDNWTWMAAPAVDIAEESQSNFPIPGQPGKFYTRRVDMESGRHFNPEEFTQACEFIGFIQPRD